MLEGDKITVKLITEQAGVPSINLLYFNVDDASVIGTLEDMVEEIANEFNDALGASRSSSAVLTCGTWENQDGNDPFTQAFFNIAGNGAANALPTNAAVRVARYSEVAGTLKVGGIVVAGIVESNVIDGRLIGNGDLGTIEQWLAQPVVLAAGPTLGQGFWYNTTVLLAPRIFTFTGKARTRSRITSLERRASRLCGA